MSGRTPDGECQNCIGMPERGCYCDAVGWADAPRGEKTTCPVCLGETTFEHDHKPDNTGLDDGPWINAPRKKAEPKPPEVTRQIRAAAWETRRAKYGGAGHR